MVSVKSENKGDLEKDVGVGVKPREVASDEKQTDTLSSFDVTKTAEGEPATEQEITNLFHVVDDIPAGVWLACVAASAERFTWYGATGPLRIASRYKLTLRFPD